VHCDAPCRLIRSAAAKIRCAAVPVRWLIVGRTNRRHCGPIRACDGTGSLSKALVMHIAVQPRVQLTMAGISIGLSLASETVANGSRTMRRVLTSGSRRRGRDAGASWMLGLLFTAWSTAGSALMRRAYVWAARRFGLQAGEMRNRHLAQDTGRHELSTVYAHGETGKGKRMVFLRGLTRAPIRQMREIGRKRSEQAPPRPASCMRDLQRRSCCLSCARFTFQKASTLGCTGRMTLLGWQKQRGCV
jgi:hypothetical protein